LVARNPGTAVGIIGVENFQARFVQQSLSHRSLDFYVIIIFFSSSHSPFPSHTDNYTSTHHHHEEHLLTPHRGAHRRCRRSA
jgi:hypothetical protein